MTWDPPGLWASLILSISGGILAGAIVLVGEILIRLAQDRRQRRKAERAICHFFRDWETTINEAADVPSGPGTFPMLKVFVQFEEHRDFLTRAANLVERWQRYLTAEQVEGLSNHLERHQAEFDSLIGEGGALHQLHYDNFFRQAHEIEWLKF